MAKKKKVVKKATKKKVAKKKTKKKTTGLKTVNMKKRAAAKKTYDPLKGSEGLHAKKMRIMKRVKTMPCTAIGRDAHGLRFCHTQAEQVYERFRIECDREGLVIRRVPIHDKGWADKYADLDNNVDRTCARFSGVWEIRDVATGQTETFGGIGDGDNGIWSMASAQTVAKKVALLDYFEVAWPQPTDHLQVVRDSIASLKGDEVVESVKQMYTPTQVKALTEETAIELLRDFWGSVLTK